MGALPVYHYVGIGLLLFLIGAIGVIIRRNAIVMFLCLELMLNGVNVIFMALGRAKGSVEGQVIVLFIMAVAAAEAAIGMAIITSYYRTHRSVDADGADLMKW